MTRRHELLLSETGWRGWCARLEVGDELERWPGWVVKAEWAKLVLLGRQRKKKREGSTPAAGLKEFFGPKISLGREENGKRIWNLWLQI
jgi:hypothetical protein